MRTVIALASCILIAGCSSGGPQAQAATPTPSDTPTSPASSPSPSGASLDPCNLLANAELVELAGDAVSAARPGLTGGLPNCQWATAEGRFVQTIGSTASDWAQALPEALRIIEASGQFMDAENLKKLRDGAALIEAGQDIDPAKACFLFSEMVELQGQPAGSPWIVTVLPTRENPQAVTGQMCSSGRFTSVMVGAEAGLEEPLPIEQVAQALKSAHRKSLG